MRKFKGLELEIEQNKLRELLPRMYPNATPEQIEQVLPVFIHREELILYPNGQRKDRIDMSTRSALNVTANQMATILN